MKINRKFSFALLFSWSVLCLQYTSADEVVRANAQGGVNWSAGTVFAHGYGVAPQEHMGTSKARLLARRAAQLDAYRNLAEILNGVRVNSETLVQDMTLASDTVRTKVDAIIKGATMTQDHYQNEVATVTMQIPMAGNLLSTVIPSDKSITSAANGVHGFPLYLETINAHWLAFKNEAALWAPISRAFASNASFVITTTEEAEFGKKLLSWLEAEGATSAVDMLQASIDAFENTSTFTGLLIDASNVADFEIAAVPTIRSESGEIIYPNDDTSYEDLVKKRPVSYDFDVNDAIRNVRVAIKPMIVKANKTYKLRKSDLVISQQDAQILKSNKTIYQVMHTAGVMVVVAD
ncbi:LPP20 family lipoprotein [Catenovulum sediminis]|uniref:LPP20 family lipoprotein n=1 Tax=Catenovulum sediminis TaxID=1740262 RepID=UPI00117DA038|nr:LPP20 family lipoprotein [Catenovulum sediminis]